MTHANSSSSHIRKSRLRSQTGRHFDFESLEYKSVVAHNGTGKILTSQVMKGKTHTSCNFVDITIMPPGTSIGLHSHTKDNEEFYIVISGSGQMQLEDELFEVTAGHVIANNPGGTHALRNTGETELRLVVIEIPSGVDL